MKKTISSLLLIMSVFAQQSYADTKSKVVTDEAELRKITDTYRSNPKRPKDFVPQGNGTVIDKRTGLQWMRCSLGQEWTGKTCKSVPNQHTWEQAKAQQIKLAGYNDWRLPTRFELETLVFCSSGKDKGRADKNEDGSPYWLKPCDTDNFEEATIVQKIFPHTSLENYCSSQFDYMIQFAFGVGKNNEVIKEDNPQPYSCSCHIRLVRTPK